MAITAGGAGGSQTHPMRLPMFGPLRRDRLFHRYYSTTIQAWMQKDRLKPHKALGQDRHAARYIRAFGERQKSGMSGFPPRRE